MNDLFVMKFQFVNLFTGSTMSGHLWAKFVGRKKSKLILFPRNRDQPCWPNCSTKSSKVQKVEKVERRIRSRGRRPFPDTRTSSNSFRSTKTFEEKRKKRKNLKKRLKKIDRKQTSRNVEPPKSNLPSNLISTKIRFKNGSFASPR